MVRLAGMALLAAISIKIFGFEVPGLLLAGRLGMLFVVHVLLSEPSSMGD